MSGSTRLLAFAAFTIAAICAVLACRYVRLHTAVDPERKPWTELDDKIAEIEQGTLTVNSWDGTYASASGIATTSPTPPMQVDRDGGLLALGAVKPDGDVGIIQVDALGHVRLSDEDITRIGQEVARVLAQQEAR